MAAVAEFMTDQIGPRVAVDKQVMTKAQAAKPVETKEDCPSALVLPIDDLAAKDPPQTESNEMLRKLPEVANCLHRSAR